jgi:1-deoxy-D-xylulose-5-phosphate reductoisomerase
VDSEHAALAQCLRGERREDVKRVVLTGSGGPFRGWTHAELAKASVKEALAHPVWQMGPKITIDSATLMNKGLEVIEAKYLFGLEYSQIHVVIHPEGIVHAIAEFRDGSMTAQLAVPDMRLPIQLALGWPERLPSGVGPVPLADKQLTFEPVDREAFPAIDLAYRVGELGHGVPREQDPPHPHRRGRHGGRRRARGTLVGGLGGHPGTGRHVGPPPGGRDHRGPVGERPAWQPSASVPSSWR